MFKIKGPTIEKLIVGFMKTVSHPLFDYQVKAWIISILYSIPKCSNLCYARYAAYVTFQQKNCPTGNLLEGEKYFSRKHNYYEYNVEAYLLPFDVDIGFTEHYSVSISLWHWQISSDSTLTSCIPWKRNKELRVEDTGIHFESYPRSWAVDGEGVSGGVGICERSTPELKATTPRAAIERWKFQFKGVLRQNYRWKLLREVQYDMGYFVVEISLIRESLR